MVWLARVVVRCPSVLLPSDAKSRLTTPDRAPVAVVSRPTLMSLESVDPAESNDMDPLAVAAPDVEPIATPRPSPGATAALAMLSAWLAGSPTRRFPKL